MAKVENCFGIVVEGHYLFLFLRQGENRILRLSKSDVNSIDIPMPSKGYLYRAFWIKDKIILNFQKEFYVLDDLLLKYEKIDDLVFPSFFKSFDDYLGQVFGETTYLQRIKNNEIVWKVVVPASKGYWHFTQEKHLFFGFDYGSSRNLVIYSFETGDLLWSINVEELGKLTRLFDGVVFKGSINYWEMYQNYVLAELINGMLIVWDVQTGNEYWRLEEIEKQNNNYTLLNDDGFIYQLKPQLCYQKIDVRTGQMVFYKDLSDRSFFNTYGYEFVTVKVYGNYFCATEQYKKCVNVFDKDTFELIYQFHLDGAIKPLAAAACPYILDGKLYQIDGDETLHVFDLVKEI